MLETILMCANIKPEDSEITVILSEKHRVGVERYLKSISLGILYDENAIVDYSKCSNVTTPTLGSINIQYK